MLNEMFTPRSEEGVDTPWQVYPRPQMRRNSYVNLNGEWDFQICQDAQFPAEYTQKIRVPFCPESALSGVKQEVPPGSYLFYRRSFTLTEEWQGKRVLLHVGAADQVADVYVNGKEAGHHSGGYNSFTMDITKLLEETNELVIRCLDDLRNVQYPYGKQTLKRGGMWYTPVSGIWQTVWLEVVPENYIKELYIQTNATGATIALTPPLEGKMICQGKEYPIISGTVCFTPEEPKLWSPEDPYLYAFTVETEEDRVESYFALRAIETKEFNGVPRLCLNGKPYFFHGLLDQGYWPDGIYTPAAPECYADDILAMKQMGFNTLRKHIKVEPAEFYYQCDKLGMVVFQDMVNNGRYSFFRDTLLPTVGLQKLPDRGLHPQKAVREQFIKGMEETVRQLRNHPCILYWTIFNEAWGQFDSDEVYGYMSRLDSTRVIDSTSGWFRRKKSEVDSRHIYFGSWRKLRPSWRPLILSEFGGYTCAVKDHLFNPDKSYGYKTCTDLKDFQQQIDKLYREKVVPAVENGLCAAIITQVSDVEDEINGFLTYDRRVNKANKRAMINVARLLKRTMETACKEK